jgi:hypothetical protein
MLHGSATPEARYEEAAAAFKEGVDLGPGFRPNWEFLVATYGLLGLDAEAAPYRETISERQTRGQILIRDSQHFFSMRHLPIVSGTV